MLDKVIFWVVLAWMIGMLVLAFFAGSALVHLAFLALLYSIPPDEKSLALDVLGNNERLSKVNVKPPEEPKQLEDLTQNQKDDGQQTDPCSQAMHRRTSHW